MRLAIMISAASVALAASGFAAQASCGDASNFTVGKTPVMVPIPHAANAAPRRPMTGPQSSAAYTIVGLWDVLYTAGGKPVYQGLEQWHSDGLEWEFADIPPVSGDVCMGVWSQTGFRTVSLYHTGWTFDSNGAPNGTMQLTHADTVSADGDHFSGTFDLKFLNAKGQVVNEVSGIDKGTRIPAP